MRRVLQTLAVVAVVLCVAPLAVHAETWHLVFSDDFESDDFDSKWAVDSGATGLSVMNGRLQATENSGIIRPRQEFQGDLRVEWDIEKVGTENYAGWDFASRLISSPIVADGRVLFDTNGVDAAAITPDGKGVPDSNPVTVDASRVNRGTAVLTYSDSRIDFRSLTTTAMFSTLVVCL